jgi:maleate cis-trans isomerase
VDLIELPRLGVVVPPENPTAEPEFNHLLGPGMNVYASRFPSAHGDLRETLESWNEALPRTLDLFGGMRLNAAVVACSASHYLLSPEGDRAFCEELSHRAGFPVRSSTQTILAACAALRVERLTLVSPYEPWLTELSREFWSLAGIEVVGVVPVPAGDVFDPYRVTTADIFGQIRRHRLRDDAALLFTGTGMPTLPALRALADTSDHVLLSSNLASAWWASRLLGKEPDHPLLRRLPPVLGTAPVASGSVRPLLI